YDFDYAEMTLPQDESFEPRRQRDLSSDAFVRWFRGITPEQWAYVGIVLLGFFLRFWALGDKPVHHDESLHAYFSWTFWKDPGSYTYDPLLHGPFQFHIIPIFYTLGALLGLSGGGANDFTVRILPALLGSGMVPLLYWLRNWLGRWGALSAAFILAVSPTFVYYSRFVRDDIYVEFFTLFLAVAVLQYSYTRRAGWLFLGVAALTLSYTAMENTFFVIAVFGSYLLAVVLWDISPAVGRLFPKMFAERDQPLAGRLIVLVPFACVMGVVALFGLHMLGQLSNTINALAATHPGATDPLNPDVTIQRYETSAVGILLIGSILISAGVIVALLVQTVRNPDEGLIPSGLPRWRRWLNPRTQPALDTLLNIHLIQWFMCFVIAWVIFAVF
ncbi:MAG TPA: flippase activity-associated protein Agl23, partial [Ktedonobacterales bacterium]|nr:flippase activity-associated protein Agl23 [Ktedonobacterales bacterium]